MGISTTDPGVGTYCISIPTGFSGFDSIGTGTVNTQNNNVNVQLAYFLLLNTIKVSLPTNNTISGTITTSEFWNTANFPLSTTVPPLFFGDIHIRLA